jgi:SnoaL-like protein
MSIHLPAAIDLYVKAENSGDVEAMSECFAPNATVRDEGRTHRGLAAIKEWKAETKRKYNHTATPLEITGTVLKAKLAGNFPGSPVTLEFRFVLEGGKIVSLEIHS